MDVSGKIVSLDKYRIERAYVCGVEVIFDDPLELGPDESVVVELDKPLFQEEHDKAQVMLNAARSVEDAP